MSRKVNLAQSEKDYEDADLVDGDTAFINISKNSILRCLQVVL